MSEELRELMREVDVDRSDYIREAMRRKVREERAKQVSTEVLVKWIREEREAR